MAGKPLQQLFWNRSVNKHWKYSVQVKCVYGESFFLPVSTWPQACDGFYYLKSHFVISLEAELEKFCSSCWPCLPASCSTWCQGQGASLCQEMVPTWDPLLHTTGLLQSCRWTGVSSGGERAQNSEPARWEGRALLAAQWRKNICFLQVSVETEYAVQGEPGSVVVRLRGTAAQCLSPGRTESPWTGSLLSRQRGCRLRCPFGSSSADCLRSFLKFS